MMRIYPEYKNPQYTYFDTFTFQGKEYNFNTCVKVKGNLFAPGAILIQVVESFLDEKGRHYWSYMCWYPSGKGHICETYRSPDQIIKEIVKEATRPPMILNAEYYKDFEMPVVLIGWVLLFLTFFFSLIFRDFFAIWLVCGAIFYHWRKGVLKKPEQHDYEFDIEEELNKIC